jgi:hypothetical protein
LKKAAERKTTIILIMELEMSVSPEKMKMAILIHYIVDWSEGKLTLEGVEKEGNDAIDKFGGIDGAIQHYKDIFNKEQRPTPESLQYFLGGKV